MIAAVAATSFLGAAAFGLLAVVTERLASQFGRPRRFVWLGAVCLTLTLTVALLGECLGLWKLRGISLAGRNSAALDIAVAVTWATTSIFCVSSLIVTLVRFSRIARTWEPSTVDHVRLFIADSHGPAIYGVRVPRIVIPRWLLDEQQPTRSALVAHEQQHVLARDHYLRVFHNVVRCLIPWNPAVRWQLEALICATEIDCDLRVLQTDSMKRLMYANALLVAWRATCRSQAVDSQNAVLSYQIRRRLKFIVGKDALLDLLPKPASIPSAARKSTEDAKDPRCNPAARTRAHRPVSSLH
jgi:hypothetical protein